MARNVKINGVTYASVPSVQIPLADNTGNATFYDTSAATIAPQYVVAGYTGYGSGGLVTGQATMPTISQDGSSKILTIS